MRIGTTKLRFCSLISIERVGRKPIKYPSINQWTIYKVTAVLQVITSIGCILWLIVGLRGLETSVPLYFIFIMALQGFGVPYSLSLHKQEISRRVYLYPMREYGS